MNFAFEPLEEAREALLTDRTEHFIELLERSPYLAREHDPDFGYTLLHHACAVGSPLVIKRLLECGANPFACDKDNFSSVRWATEKLQLSALQAIHDHLQKDSYRVEDCPPPQRSCLCVAIQSGLVPLIELTLKIGYRGSVISPVVPTDWAWSELARMSRKNQWAQCNKLPLTSAQREERITQIAQLFIDFDITPLAQDMDGMHALHYAVYHNNTPLLNWLLDYFKRNGGLSDALCSPIQGCGSILHLCIDRLSADAFTLLFPYSFTNKKLSTLTNGMGQCFFEHLAYVMQKTPSHDESYVFLGRMQSLYEHSELSALVHSDRNCNAEVSCSQRL